VERSFVSFFEPLGKVEPTSKVEPLSHEEKKKHLGCSLRSQQLKLYSPSAFWRQCFLVSEANLDEYYLAFLSAWRF
jgi:hypothetical protein